MSMRTTESIDLDAPAETVFPHVSDLGAYPAWLPLVHTATPDLAHPGDQGPAWIVELRAQVGPFARSKRLRMVRVAHQPPHSAAFERVETDGRQHARWSLRVEADERSGERGRATRLTMHLAYDGALWTGGLLERVLDDQIRRGKAGLAAMLTTSAPPTR